MKKGFLLIELLVALSLFGMVSLGLTQTFLLGIQAEKTIRANFEAINPIRLVFIRLEKDLRNAVRLHDFPFSGSQSTIQFVSNTVGPEGKGLYLIRYRIQGKKLLRSARFLDSGRKQRAHEKVVFRFEKSFEWSFAYTDTDQKIFYQPSWEVEPYGGLPRALKVSFNLEGKSLHKVISMAQGKLGVIHA